MTFIRYIGVNFHFGPLDCVRYNGDFVIPGFVKTGLCSIHFTVILPGPNISFVITGTSLNRGSLYRGSTVYRFLTKWGSDGRGSKLGC